MGAKIAKWRMSPTFITVAVSYAMVTDAIAYDIVIPFLPAFFIERLGVPLNQVQGWMSLSLESFGIAMLCTNYIAAYAVDKVSSKSAPFMAGGVMLLLSTLLFFLSTTPELVIASRALQGASCAMVWTSGLAFLTSRIAEADIGYYMGYALMGSTIGELIGPIMGGSLYEAYGHWAVFASVEVLIAIDVLFRVLVVDSSRVRTVSAAVENLPDENEPLLAQIQRLARPEPEQLEDNHPSNEAAAVDIEDQMIAIRWNWLATGVVLLLATVYRCALETVTPLFVNRFFGWSTAAAGSVMFALLVPTLLSPVVSSLASRRGPGPINAIACAICSFALAALGFLTTDTLYSKILFVADIGVIGVCVATCIASCSTGIMTLVKRREAVQNALSQQQGVEKTVALWPTPGSMMSTISTCFALALIMGPACASMFDYTHEDQWLTMCFILSGLAVFATGCSIFTWRNW